MSEYGRIEVHERNDVNKSNGSCKHVTFLYWLFVEIKNRYDLELYIVASSLVKENYCNIYF